MGIWGSLQAGGDVVADLGRGATQAGGFGAGLADAVGRVALAEVVEHEGGGQDRRDGVGRALAGDVGAEPWTGSNIDGPVRAGFRLPLDANPIPPDTAPPRSVRMSPKRLSVTTTSYCCGDCTK